MGTNIKLAIMETARRLFSEQGFQNTSMRDIAAALNISVGNLTYHYKKKEHLIEAIVLEDHQKYSKPAPLLNLADLKRFLQDTAAQKNSRPYYFQHYTQLAQICPAIYKMQVAVLQDLNHALLKSFENFINNGILKEEFCQEYDKIADVIITLIAYGIPAIKHISDSEKDSFWFDCVWSILIPCLTEQGLKEYQALKDI